MVNAQQWLERQYNTREKRNNTKELHIDNRSLEGELDLSDFINLERLICLENRLTKITISPLAKEKLTYLDISNNNFPEQGLSFLTDYLNLEFLSLGNDKDPKVRIEKDIYNRFIGSLEPLKNMKNLKILWINNTNLDSGLEYLPDSLKRIYCDNNLKEESKVGEIQKQLLLLSTRIRNDNNYYKSYYYYCDYQVWLKERQEMEKIVNEWLIKVVNSGLSEKNANHSEFQLEAKKQSLQNIDNLAKSNDFTIYKEKNAQQQRAMLLTIKHLIATGKYKVSWSCGSGTNNAYASDDKHTKEVLETLVNKFEALINSQASVQQQLSTQIQVTSESNIIKLDNDIRARQALKDISVSSWNKIVFLDNKQSDRVLRNLFSTVLGNTLLDDKNHKLASPVADRPGMIRISSYQVVSDLKKIVDDRLFKILLDRSNPKVITIDDWTNITISRITLRNILTEDTKFDIGWRSNTFFNSAGFDKFAGVNRAKAKSLEAFQFLQKYAGDYSFNIVYPAGETFDEKELKNIADIQQQIQVPPK